MNKEIFLHQLRIRLTQLPPQETQKRLDYYAELIDDMVEDGVSEEAAVASFGDVNLLAQQILREASLSHLVKAKATPKKGWTTTAIILAVIGSPLWVPLLFAFIAVIGSIFIVIAAVIIAIFAVVISIGFAGIILLFKAFTLTSSGIGYVLLTIGFSFIFVGLCLLGILAAKAAAVYLTQFSRYIYGQIKSLFIKQEV
ncbi:DUF1700 domain-containing protein [Anaerovoracaceae bacterium 41-7]|jgi:uncharacterized membrane protein|uniref:DUF1700 domain-containing protein n=1 Tax=Anaerotruncus colihominis TaxID=169435 RepID=A0A845QJQ5_9FIRM|nr:MULTISPECIES: DUF1700 domain-containing protein [Clostridia]MCI9475534.1 DUF1700 domain-containing protein [Emergencia sp.]NBH62422.1 DUF1700 domain-containing protein [Anaerotruncus colihominis]NCE98584.1 DUF1700 domain-containing protein [Emergencia sp. 1XD21-10]NCF03077.1 DUF1700 domain-containing protein [Anaerotruncus sp. 80]